ncbi:MAG: hypothetical protein COT15_03685 [Candidatus Diapherotrites archaeon CG08_land_8_20_14_0_20_34_12]|nr:MAG: hypothetical protein COT15_03685 [Candidatus Diapherotrites archaeon CG08_land_8_20_14_0_20_34_12]
MGLRPAHCYRSINQRAFTRTAVVVHDKNYVGTSPAVKIRQFNMGNPEYPFDTVVDLIAEQAMVIRDNAIESVRMTINRYLQRKLGVEGYFMKIRVYPHHILRENKQAQGAGADRVSQGMRLSFGRPIGRAIRAKEGLILMSILVDEKNKAIAQEAFHRTSAKIPCKLKIHIHKDVKSIGTKPRKTKMVEEKVEEKTEEVAATTETAATTATTGTKGATGGKAATTAPATTGKVATGKDAAKPAKEEKKK